MAHRIGRNALRSVGRSVVTRLFGGGRGVPRSFGWSVNTRLTWYVLPCNSQLRLGWGLPDTAWLSLNRREYGMLGIFSSGFSVSPHFVRLRLPTWLVTVCHAVSAGLWIPDFVVDGAACPAASAGL